MNNKLNKETLISFIDSQVKMNNRLISQKKCDVDYESNIHKIININDSINRLTGSVDALNSIKTLVLQSDFDMPAIKQNKVKETTIDVGDIVRNKRDDKVGLVIRIFKSGSIAVLEKISPFCISTHENHKTLEIVEKNGIDIFNELEK